MPVGKSVLIQLGHYNVHKHLTVCGERSDSSVWLKIIASTKAPVGVILEKKNSVCVYQYIVETVIAISPRMPFTMYICTSLISAWNIRFFKTNGKHSFENVKQLV